MQGTNTEALLITLGLFALALAIDAAVIALGFFMAWLNRD